jgi:uncharacterized protein
MNTPYPIARPPLPRGVRLDGNVYVAMRDGIKVALDIYRPEAEGRYPALLSMSPYIKELQQRNPILCHSIEAGATPFFASKGYVHAIASVRGSGFSQGQYNYYSPKEQEDGYDLVEWISGQSWCNGNVGMIGDSYFGKIQYSVAAQKPPHLKCIVPYDAGTDQYRDVCYQGGAFWAQFLGMWGPDTIQQCLWPGPVEGKLRPADFMGDVLSHPEDGPYYWERSPWKFLNDIDVPVFSIVPLTGVHSRGQLYAYPRLHAPKKLLVVPRPEWIANVLFIGSEALNTEIVRWLDHWLKGVDTGIMGEAPVTIFDSGTLEWHAENEYPLARTQWTTLYLHSNAAGSREPAGSMLFTPPGNQPPDTYTPLDPESHGPERAGEAVRYCTPSLTEDTRVWGPLSFTLYGSTTFLDTIWFIKLGETGPDGKQRLLTQGHLKASFREVDPSNSGPGQPFHPFRTPVLPEPNVVYRYDVEMMPIFHTFRRGHQIWVQIASRDDEYQGRLRSSYVYDNFPSQGENAVYHSSDYPSHLVLPLIPDPGPTNRRPLPGSGIKWPL